MDQQKMGIGHKRGSRRLFRSMRNKHGKGDERYSSDFSESVWGMQKAASRGRGGPTGNLQEGSEAVWVNSVEKSHQLQEAME